MVARFKTPLILTTIAVVLTVGGLSALAAARTNPFTVGETLDPGTESVEPCGPTDTNCFPSVNSLSPIGTASGETGLMRFLELAVNGSHSVGFRAPDSISANVLWTLPSADGTADQILKTNGSGVLSWTTPSSGLTSLNGLTGATQTFASSTGATDFKIVSSGTTHTLYFPNSSASNRGLLTAADWTTFNSKLGALTPWTTNVDADFYNLIDLGTVNATGTWQLTGIDQYQAPTYTLPTKSALTIYAQDYESGIDVRSGSSDPGNYMQRWQVLHENGPYYDTMAYFNKAGHFFMRGILTISGTTAGCNPPSLDADLNCTIIGPWPEYQVGAWSDVGANGITIAAHSNVLSTPNFGGIDNDGNITFKVTATGEITGTNSFSLGNGYGTGTTTISNSGSLSGAVTLILPAQNGMLLPFSTTGLADNELLRANGTSGLFEPTNVSVDDTDVISGGGFAVNVGTGLARRFTMGLITDAQGAPALPSSPDLAIAADEINSASIAVLMDSATRRPIVRCAAGDGSDVNYSVNFTGISVDTTMDSGDELCALAAPSCTCIANSVLDYGDAGTVGAATVTKSDCATDIGGTGLLFSASCQ